MRNKFLAILTIFFMLFIVQFSYAYDPISGEDEGDEWGDTQVQESAEKPVSRPERVYPPYTGPKKRIAVTKFVNKARGVYGSWALGEGFAEMLTTDLIKTGRFIVIERQALHDVIGEQELGQSGLVRKETAAKVGQMLGAQIIVRGVVSEFQLQQSGGGGGIAIKGIRLGMRASNAHVAVDIRLIDSTTGQVLHSHNAVGKAESSGLSLGIASGDVAFGAEGFQKTPLGQATRQAIHDAVRFIISRMEAVPFTAKVVKFSGGKVYINAGASTNIKIGDKLYAYAKGEEFIDPDTGLSLGSEETLIGTVEVRDVKKKYSIGYLVSGSGALKRGDILKFR